MNLDQLKEEARKDLVIVNEENLDSESKTVELDKSSDGKNEALLQ